MLNRRVGSSLVLTDVGILRRLHSSALGSTGTESHSTACCLLYIISYSTCISSDTALLLLPEHCLVFWQGLWKITTPVQRLLPDI